MKPNVNYSDILYEEKDSFDIKKKSNALAKKYALPVKWIKRGLEVCKRLKIKPDFFISKYILEENISRKLEFEKFFFESLKKDQDLKENIF